MTCLICRYYQPTEPPQHKQDREAGRCESGCGNKWTTYTAVNYVKKHGELQGWCRLHPEPKPFAHTHVCGDISVLEYFYNAHWGVEKLGPDQTLFEWACEVLETVLHGTWRSRDHERLAEQNIELRRQLKQVRKISASRFKRLQKVEAKPEQPAEPFYPRLVAAE